MAQIKEGDAVEVAARETTAQDAKSGLYYPHYAGLRGTVLKVYGEEASLSVSRDSLPTDIRARHEESEKAMRQNWLDKLSEEARGRLSEGDRRFSLNYAVLVALNDLTPDTGAARRAAEAETSEPVRPSAEERREAKAFAQSALAVDPLSGESEVGRTRKNAAGALESGTESASRRLSAADIESREAAYLAERQAAERQTDGKSRKK